MSSGKSLTISFLKIGDIFIIFRSAVPASRKEESVVLVLDIDVSS